MPHPILVRNHRCGTDHVHRLDAVARILQPIASSGKDFLVTNLVQFGKPFGEFQLLSIDIDATVGSLAALDVIGQVIGIDGKKPAHAGALVFQIAGSLGFTTVVHHVVLQLAKHEVQHVVEMHANVGGHAKGLTRITLPAFQVPLAAAGDVSESDIKLGIGRSGSHLLAQGEDGIMVTQLQDVVHALAGFTLDQRQVVQQLGRGHQRFFADHVGAQAQAGGDVRVVQVVGRADADVIQRGSRIALEAMGVVVEALEIGKERALRRDAVDDADRVVGVVGHGQVVAQVPDGVHVARGDVAGGADEGEVLAIAHGIAL